MQSTRSALALLAVGGLLAFTAIAQPAGRKGESAESAAGAKVGAAAPEFELKGADGKTYKLSDYKDKTVVVEWLNQDCPFSHGAVPKVNALAESYGAKGVVWLGIDSTHNQTAENDAKYAQAQKIQHPILMDTDGKVGHLYGAKTTPHIFIIHKGKVVYSGALDNDPQKNKPKDEYRGYVDEALTAVLAGKEVPLATNKPWGCPVKYKK